MGSDLFFNLSQEKRKNKSDPIFRGFTLVELLVASSILLTLLVAYLGAYKNIMTAAGYTQGITLANAACQAKLEEIMAADFDSIIADYGPGGTHGNTWTINIPAGTSGFSSTTLFGRGRLTITDRPELYGGGFSQATPAAAWSARDDHTSLVYNNRMWIMGGIVDDGAGDYNVNDVWWTDDTDLSDGQTWTQATASANWTARRFHASTVYNNRMWVMGGEVFWFGPYFNDVWSSADGVNWSLVKPNDAIGWIARSRHGSLVYDNKMWILGGRRLQGGGYVFVNDVWYSTDGLNWTCADSSAEWSPREVETALVYDNKMWIMGGGSSGGTYYNDVWWTDDLDFSDGQTWTQAKPNDANGWSARGDHGRLVYDNKMWVISGYAGSLFNDVWYSTDGANWICATPSANWPERDHPTPLVYDNKMWIMSGATDPVNPGSDASDVWYSSGYNRMLEVTIEACWKQPDGRVFGEDLNLDGNIEIPAEDVNGNGVPDWGTRIRVLLTRDKNLGNLRRTYFGR